LSFFEKQVNSFIGYFKKDNQCSIKNFSSLKHLEKNVDITEDISKDKPDIITKVKDLHLDSANNEILNLKDHISLLE